jgi:hypothetical protein
VRERPPRPPPRCRSRARARGAGAPAAAREVGGAGGLGRGRRAVILQPVLERAGGPGGRTPRRRAATAEAPPVTAETLRFRGAGRPRAGGSPFNPGRPRASAKDSIRATSRRGAVEAERPRQRGGRSPAPPPASLHAGGRRRPHRPGGRRREGFHLPHLAPSGRRFRVPFLHESREVKNERFTVAPPGLPPPRAPRARWPPRAAGVAPRARWAPPLARARGRVTRA